MELKTLFLNGVDSEGYGLNLCTDEKIFQEFRCHLPVAYKLKHQSIFIPLHESFSEKTVSKLGQKLSRIMGSYE